MKRLLSLLMMGCIVSATWAVTVPDGRLFQFERSKNRNYVCYDVNQQNGKLNAQNPISVYWIRAEEDGAKQELSFLQRKLAFGYKVLQKGNNQATVHLTAYDKLPIKVCKKKDNWVALCTINGQEMQITKMFAQLRSPNSLHVEYVDIYGINLSTGKTVKERIQND